MAIAVVTGSGGSCDRWIRRFRPSRTDRSTGTCRCGSRRGPTVDCEAARDPVQVVSQVGKFDLHHANLYCIQIVNAHHDADAMQNVRLAGFVGDSREMFCRQGDHVFESG